jgi:hypothetical protein
MTHLDGNAWGWLDGKERSVITILVAKRSSLQQY